MKFRIINFLRNFYTFFCMCSVLSMRQQIQQQILSLQVLKCAMHPSVDFVGFMGLFKYYIKWTYNYKSVIYFKKKQL